MKALELNLKYLAVLQLWPRDGKSFKHPWFLAKVALILLYTSTSSLGGIVALVRHFGGWDRYDLYDIIETVAVIFTSLGFYYLLACYMIKLPNISDLFDKLNDFEVYLKPTTFDSDNKKLDFLLKIYMYYTIIGSYYFCCLSLFSLNHCERTKDPEFNKNCILFVQVWTPFDISYTPMREIAFVILTTGACHFTITGAALFGLMLNATQNVIIRIEKLKELFSTCLEGEDEGLKRRKLAYCVKYHNFIISLTKDVNNCFGSMLFIMITLFSIVMGIIAFLFSRIFAFKTALHFSGWFMTLFMVSFMGQRLINEAATLTDVIYDMDWYKTDAELQRSIVLILKQSQAGLELRASKMSTISFPTFQAILKTTYSYIALLNMVMEEEI